MPPREKETLHSVDLEKIRDAVSDCFDISRCDADQWVVHVDDDRGKWSPGALAIVYSEEFVFTDSPNDPRWSALSDSLSDLGLFYEHINAAVVGIYR